MTIRDILSLNLSDAARICFVTLEECRVEGGIRELAGILGWSEGKTGRVLKELQEAELISVEYRFRQPAQILISDGSVEPAPDNRSVKTAGSCMNDLDCVSTDQSEQSRSEDLDPADMPDLSEIFPEKESDSPDDLQTRLEKIAFSGIEWLIKTYSVEVIDEKLATIEQILEDPNCPIQNPAALLNAAIRGRCSLYCPMKKKAAPPRRAEETASPAREDLERIKQASVEMESGNSEEREKLAEESPHRELWEEIKAELSERICQQSLRSWFDPCYIRDVDNGRIVLDAGTEFVAEWVQENYRKLLEEIVGADVEIVSEAA